MKDPRKSTSNDSRADFRKSRNKSSAVVAPGVGGVDDNAKRRWRAPTAGHPGPKDTRARRMGDLKCKINRTRIWEKMLK